MENILGIVAEYNPFHYGHLYHLEQSKKLIKPDCAVAVMSGNFVQRGEPALIDKWSRTEMALKNGVDLVIELPLIYSISSAENYAFGAIKILKSLGNSLTLSFGSECGDIDILSEIADIFIYEPKEYLAVLNHDLSRGMSFPKAREHAALMYLNNIRKFSKVLKGPNNILATEYLKAIKILNAKNINLTTIKRKGSEYDDLCLSDKYSSATAIRHAVSTKEDVEQFVPKNSYDILKNKIDNNEIIYGLKKYEQAILYAFRTMTLEEIANLPDVCEGLENLIKKSANSCNTLEELISKIKSKRYTLTRINRILLYALLFITKTDMEESYKANPYIRVLGMNEKGKELISNISKNNKKLNIITSPKKFLDTSKNKVLKNMLEKDILASNIYTLGYTKNSRANLDFTNKLITV